MNRRGFMAGVSGAAVALALPRVPMTDAYKTGDWIEFKYPQQWYWLARDGKIYAYPVGGYPSTGWIVCTVGGGGA